MFRVSAVVAREEDLPRPVIVPSPPGLERGGRAGEVVELGRHEEARLLERVDRAEKRGELLRIHGGADLVAARVDEEEPAVRRELAPTIAVPALPLLDPLRGESLEARITIRGGFARGALGRDGLGREQGPGASTGANS